MSKGLTKALTKGLNKWSTRDGVTGNKKGVLSEGCGEGFSKGLTCQRGERALCAPRSPPASCQVGRGLTCQLGREYFVLALCPASCANREWVDLPAGRRARAQRAPGASGSGGAGAGPWLPPSPASVEGRQPQVVAHAAERAVRKGRAPPVRRGRQGFQYPDAKETKEITSLLHSTAVHDRIYPEPPFRPS